MSTQAEATSVRSSIVVDAPLDLAFSVFTDDIGSWFPSEYNLLDTDIVERVFEPREWAAMSTTGARTAGSATGPECSPTNLRGEW